MAEIDKVPSMAHSPGAPEDRTPTKGTEEAAAAPAPIKVGDKEYKTPDELAKAYEKLHSKFGEAGKERGDLKAQNKVLAQQLEALMKQQQSKPEEAKPKTDYEAMRLDIAKKVSNGDLSAEEGLDAMAKWSADFANYKASDAMERAVATMREQLDAKFQDLEARKIQEKFQEKNPDYPQVAQSGELDRYMAENPMHDQFSAYYAYKADQLAARLQEIEGRVQSGAKPTGPVVASPGNQIRNTNPTNQGPRAPSDRRAAMLAAIQNRGQ